MNFFLHNLTGRTLDTVEGKPGSLRQTAEEVIKCLGAPNRLIVLCEMVLCETKRNEMKSVLCEMKSVLCEMKICTLRNENLYFAK